MRARIAPDVTTWWAGRHNGLNDNSLPGVAELDSFAPVPSPDIYYFTMSFCATQPFPNRTLTAQDINEFVGLLPLVWNPGGILGTIAAPLHPLGTWLRVLPQLQAVLTWVTDVANRHLQQMGYFCHIPRPGTHIPRSDILPLIAFPAYAMGGLEISANGLRNITLEELKPNDGIVNTISMDGPVNGPIDNGSFAAKLAAVGTAGVKGIYWHLGTNSTIDHADQIGVFTHPATVRLSPHTTLISSLRSV